MESGTQNIEDCYGGSRMSLRTVDVLASGSNNTCNLDDVAIKLWGHAIIGHSDLPTAGIALARLSPARLAWLSIRVGPGWPMC